MANLMIFGFYHRIIFYLGSPKKREVRNKFGIHRNGWRELHDSIRSSSLIEGGYMRATVRVRVRLVLCRVRVRVRVRVQTTDSTACYAMLRGSSDA